MKDTLENKVKFFAQYYHQKVLIDNSCLKYLNSYDLSSGIEHSILELKPISSITDEDAEDYLHFIGCHSFGDRILQAKIQIKEDCHNDIHMIDYLRSKGYALPYMGLSVEKQIEYGWIKI